MPSRCGRLLLSASADARSSDDVIALSRPYPVSYVVLVVTYISGAMLTGKLAQRRQGGGAIVWAGTLATVVQLLWILMAAQPFIHVCIFFRKRENRTVLMCRCCPARCQRGVNHDEELAEWAETAPMMPVEIPPPLATEHLLEVTDGLASPAPTGAGGRRNPISDLSGRQPATFYVC